MIPKNKEMERTDILVLICETCGSEYEKSENFKKWNEERPNQFFKWSLLYCDKCRHKKESDAMKYLSDVICALGKSLNNKT